MRAREFLTNGGWANSITQTTHITPLLVVQVLKVLDVFVQNLNNHLEAKNIPPVELGTPCGSTTYYQRDLIQDPDREYGDIDVNLHIPRIEGISNNANTTLIQNEVKNFCDGSRDFQTQNGTNVIFKMGEDHVQVDLVTSYLHNKAWSQALAPEYQVKGLLCNSLYSSLGETLHLSIGGGHGIQAKLQNNVLVPFRTVKDVKLTTITVNPKTWAVDIVKYFGCKTISNRLKSYPGLLDEVHVADIINSIKGIAETLELNGKLPNNFDHADEMLRQVKSIYLSKIGKAINSSKFDKASSEAAIAKAEQTKAMLSSKSEVFAKLII